MENALTTVRSPFLGPQIAYARGPESLPREKPPLEGEYIPPESVHSQGRQPIDIIFRLFVEINLHRGALTEEKEYERSPAYGISAYQKYETFPQEQRIKGNYIDIMI